MSTRSIVPAGATLNLNGLHLYANTENIKGTITGGVVSPTTVEWISSTSGNWDVASNWSTGTVPSSNEDVIINVPGATPDRHDQLGLSVGLFHHGQRSDIDHGRLADRRGRLDDQRRPVDDRRFADRERVGDFAHGHGDDDGFRSEPICRGWGDAEFDKPDRIHRSERLHNDAGSLRCRQCARPAQPDCVGRGVWLLLAGPDQRSVRGRSLLARPHHR